MPFKIALSQNDSWQRSAPAAGGMASELLASPKARKLAFSALACLAIATVSAMSDFKNSVFANLGLGKGAFSDPPVDTRTLIGSSASPDRGGSSSWSLDYLVQANSSFIQAVKERAIHYIIKKPPMPAPPPVTPPDPSAIANGLNWDGAGGAGGIVQQMRQVQPRRPSLPQGFAHGVVSAGGQGGGEVQSAFSPMAAVPRPTSSVAVANVPALPPAVRPALVQSQPASYVSHPAARAVIGGRYQTGYSGGAGAGRYHRDSGPSYGQ